MNYFPFLILFTFIFCKFYLPIHFLSHSFHLLVFCLFLWARKSVYLLRLFVTRSHVNLCLYTRVISVYLVSFVLFAISQFSFPFIYLFMFPWVYHRTFYYVYLFFVCVRVKLIFVAILFFLFVVFSHIFFSSFCLRVCVSLSLPSYALSCLPRLFASRVSLCSYSVFLVFL